MNGPRQILNIIDQEFGRHNLLSAIRNGRYEEIPFENILSKIDDIGSQSGNLEEYREFKFEEICKIIIILQVIFKSYVVFGEKNGSDNVQKLYFSISTRVVGV